ncbi:MAG: hypothetical protein QOE90_2927 [Thermoplasmata archaeon]|jgi:hypothetical protein|nr:hypothetical protein [Thermoplasmata archaeon]
MPRGVTDQFLGLLKRERRAQVRTLVLMLLALAPAYFMAELTDQPLLGLVVWMGVAALALGGGLGLLWARWETGRHETSLRAGWNAWMRMSLTAGRLSDVERAVRQKGPALHVEAIGWTALLVANATLFLALWMDAAWALAFGAGVTVANGLVLGALAGRAAWTYRWVRTFSHALDGLIAEGQVGLWGEV